jgi:hypothetical protein
MRVMRRTSCEHYGAPVGSGLASHQGAGFAVFVPLLLFETAAQLSFCLRLFSVLPSSQPAADLAADGVLLCCKPGNYTDLQELCPVVGHHCCYSSIPGNLSASALTTTAQGSFL